jgi:hypothetical protein
MTRRNQKAQVEHVYDILDDLKAKYLMYLDSAIVNARIVQTDEDVWLELTRENVPYHGDVTIQRTNLDFIRIGSELHFSPDNPVFHNAYLFTEVLDPYSIAMTTDLFHVKAREQICEEFGEQKDGGEEASVPSKALVIDVSGQ